MGGDRDVVFPFSTSGQDKRKGMKILGPALMDEGNAAAEGAGWHFSLTH